VRRAAVAVALAALACASRPVPVEPGALQGSTYRNDALDLRVALPPGWAFLTDEEVAAEVRAAYPDRPELHEPRSGATALFTMVDRGSPPAPGRARRAVSARAEAVRKAPAGVTSEVFADELENSLRNDHVVSAFGARRQAIVAGRRFVVIATEMERAGVRAKLDHYVRYESGRLLVLTFSYPPEESAPPQVAVEALGPVPASTEAAKGKP
jgi:hypothetical protein